MKNKFRKITALFTAVCMSFSLFTASSLFSTANAAETESELVTTDGLLNYKILEDGTIEVLGNTYYTYDSDKREIVIPSEIDGYKVTSIASKAFYSWKYLKKVTISDVVTSIGRGAFQYCESLESVTIPDSVTIIGEKTFELCDALENVTINNGVKNIGKKAFDSCDNLKSVTIPGSVTSMVTLHPIRADRTVETGTTLARH